MEARNLKKLVYSVLTVDLGTAHIDTEYVLPGIFDTVVVMSLSPTASASIRLNDRSRDLLDLVSLKVINAMAIDRIFLTNIAQAGLTLVLAFGADASFGVSLANPGTFIVSGPWTTSAAVANLYDGMPSGTTVLLTGGIELVHNPATGYERVKTPIIYKTAQCSTAAATAVWTPAAGKKFRVMGGVITSSASLAAAAESLVSLLDAATAINLVFNLWIPVVANANAVTPIAFDLKPNGYVSSTINNVLNVTLTANLNAGHICVTVWGTEE